MTISDRTLLGAALGVLDPGDALAVGEASGPAEHLQQSGLAALSGLSLPRALAPPSLERGPGGTLGALERSARVGERVSFQLRWPGLPGDARCAVFRQAGGALRRLYPSAARWTPLSGFRQRDGAPLIELVVEPPAGLQRYDLVLVSGTLSERPWPDGSPAWEVLHRDFLAGRGYGVSVEVEVS